MGADMAIVLCDLSKYVYRGWHMKSAPVPQRVYFVEN